MKIPDNITLPFFAYGLFKPGQLCFYRIKELVKNVSSAEIEGILKERDGIPLLVLSEGTKIKGALIQFKEGFEEEAYKRIIEIEPDEVYQWKENVRALGNICANVLLGRRPDKGSTDLEHVDNWDGRKDPYFLDAIEEIEVILRDNSKFDWDFKKLFRLQMAYSLLWICLERYAGLRYHFGEEVSKKLRYIADEDGFIGALKKYVKRTGEVHSATDPRKRSKLDPDDSRKSIDYYYQVRCNSIHRGKAVVKDFDILRESAEELLNIFKDMLSIAWDTSVL
jgi:hypothetical protein